MLSNKRILLISHSNYLGGAELCLLETLQLLNNTGKYDLQVVFPKQKGQLEGRMKNHCSATYQLFLPYWIDNGVRYTTTQKLKRIKEIAVATIKAVGFIKKTTPDIIITNTSVIPSFALAARMKGIKHLWFVHELVEEDFGCRYLFGKRISKRMIGWLSDTVITNSNFVNKTYFGLVKPNKLKMLYQPVELKSTDTLISNATEVLRLLIIGKISDFKGQLDAIKAACILLQKGHKVELTILGEGDEKYIQYLKNEIPVDLQKNILFVAFSNDPVSYYTSTDMVLVCSRCEALGRVTIEAMKAGKPVIASRAGANTELIEDGVNGYLYEPGNIAQLTEKILLLQLPEHRIVFGQRGKAFANSHFNTSKYIAEFSTLLS